MSSSAAASAASADAAAPAAPTTHVEEDFKAAVKAYIDMHDRLAAASKELRDVRKKKTELQAVIVAYMKRNEIDECMLQDGKLVRKSSKRLEPLKKEHIVETLRAQVGDRADDVLLDIFSRRGVSERDTLRRTKKRGD